MINNKKSTYNFIKKSTNIHGDKYDYSLVVYTNARTPVDIICKTHGLFKQIPDVHVNRKGNCPQCGYEQRRYTKMANNNWISYHEGKKIIQSLNLENINDWNNLCKWGNKPKNIPASPRTTYGEDWKGWEDWLGTNGKTKDFLPFNEAQQVVHEFNLRSYEDWIHFCSTGNRPNNIPFNPKQKYSKDWKSWGDWLGYHSRANGNLSGVVYILQYDNLPEDVYKIGRTYRLDKRLYEHNRLSNCNIKVVYTHDVDNMSQAERDAHSLALKCGKVYEYRRSKEHFQIKNIDTFIEQLKNAI